MIISSLLCYIQPVYPLEPFIYTIGVQEGHVTTVVTEDTVATITAGCIDGVAMENDVSHSRLSVDFGKTL